MRGFPDADRSGGGLFRLSRQECIAIDLEQTRLALPASAAEGINGRADLYFDEAAFFQHPPPACARQATGNSVSPQVNIADSRFRHCLAGCDVGELQSSARTQHPHDLAKDAVLVGAKVDDAVADDDIGLTVLDRQILDDSPPELDICEAHRRCRRAGALQHLVGHIDADDPTLGSDLFGGDKAVEAAARPKVNDPLAGFQRPLREWITDPGKRFDSAFGHPGDNGVVVAQSPGQRASRMEMEGAVRIDRDISILGLHFIAEGHRVNW